MRKLLLPVRMRDVVEAQLAALSWRVRYVNAPRLRALNERALRACASIAARIERGDPPRGAPRAR